MRVKDARRLQCGDRVWEINLQRPLGAYYIREVKLEEAWGDMFHFVFYVLTPWNQRVKYSLLSRNVWATRDQAREEIIKRQTSKIQKAQSFVYYLTKELEKWN